jgi:hypothetical protein
MMTVITVELIDPRVKALLSKLRSREDEAPGMEEMTREVKKVRTQRKKSNG